MLPCSVANNSAMPRPDPTHPYAHLSFPSSGSGRSGDGTTRAAADELVLLLLHDPQEVPRLSTTEFYRCKATQAGTPTMMDASLV
jgi:hypothetical protein